MKIERGFTVNFEYFPGEIAAALCEYIGENDPEFIDNTDSALKRDLPDIAKRYSKTTETKRFTFV